MTRLLSEGPKPFKQPIVDSSVVVWVQPRQFERATVENEREWSPQIAFVSPSQPRVIKPRARAMDKVAEPPLTTLLHLLSPSVALLAWGAISRWNLSECRVSLGTADNFVVTLTNTVARSCPVPRFWDTSWWWTPRSHPRSVLPRPHRPLLPHSRKLIWNWSVIRIVCAP